MKNICFTFLALFLSLSSFAIPGITGVTAVCPGATVTMTDTTGGTWTSSVPGVATIGSSSGIVTTISPGTTIITFTLGSSTATLSLTVEPTPSVFTVTGGGHYCAGGTGVHIGLSFSQVGVTYQVKLAGSPVGLPTAGTGSPIDFGSFTLAGTYTVTGTNSFGCSANMTGSVSILVDPLPTLFTVTGGGTYCMGGTGVPVGLSGSETGITYQLLRGSTPIGSPVSGSGLAVSFGPIATSGTYTVIATDPATGCTATMTGTVSVTVSPLPTTYLLIGAGSRCAGALSHIGLAGSDTGVTYTLDSAGVTLATVGGTGDTIYFGYHALSSFSIIATNHAGCTTTIGPAVIIITPTVTPSVTFTVVPGDTVCPGTTVTCTEISVNGGAAPTYQWMVNGINVGVGGVYSYTPSNGDEIRLTMLSDALCAVPATATYSVTMTVLPCSTAGIKPVAEANVTLYPNPADNELTVLADGTQYSSLSITNNLGQELIRLPLTGKQTVVNVSKLPVGMYYLTLRGSEGSLVRRFVK